MSTDVKLYLIGLIILALAAILIIFWLGQKRHESKSVMVPILWAAAFAIFVITGIGIATRLISTSPNSALHDTYYVVAHFHYIVFLGVAFLLFFAFYNWFEKILRFAYSKLLALIHLALFFIGINVMTFSPFLFGLNNVHQRYIDYAAQYELYNQLSTYGVYILIGSFMAFFIVIIDALIVRRPQAGKT